MGWLDFLRNPAVDSDPSQLRKLQALLPDSVVHSLTERITASEALHSGEICICVEYSMPSAFTEAQATPRQRALELFSSLRVWDTEYNNGVLLYVLHDQHAIEVVADRGFNRHVSAAQWQSVVTDMQAPLQQGQLAAALHAAIDAVTALLVTHFPPQPHLPRYNDVPNTPVLLG